MIDEPPISERPTYGPVSGSPVAPPPAAPARRSSWPWLVAAVLAVFALGMIASPWFEATVRSQLPGSAVDPAGAQIAAQGQEIAALRARVEALEARGGGTAPATAPLAAVPAGTPGERLARVETRVEAVAQAQATASGRIDALAGAVGGLQVRVDESARKIDTVATGAAEGAQQAQAILLLAAARRAIETAQPLGALEPALRSRLPERAADIDTIVAAARQPATVAQLRAEFARLRPTIEGSAADAAGEGWWQRLKAQASSLVQLRRADAPAPSDPASRLLIAQRRLEAGDLAGAIAIVERLPASRAVTLDWLSKARKHAAAVATLDRLEGEVFAPEPAMPPALPVPAAPTAL
ncbi:MAG: hypothetical protein INF91_02705 [Alphaproteobacteria bacterium]|nr:hypothetical protein [Alphaproteobacteria bacterium]